MKKSLSLLLLAALAACNGDSTGARPSLQGQWLYRARIDQVRGNPVQCAVQGVVTFQQAGAQVTGHMPRPAALCPGLAGGLDRTDLDSTTTLSGSVQGDSLLLTLQGPGLTVRQSVRLLGDSLAGTVLEPGGGVVGARLYPASVPLGRATVHLTGAVQQEQVLYARMNGAALFMEPTFGASGLVVVPYDRLVPLAAGTFGVGALGSWGHGQYAGPLNAAGHFDPFVDFTSGQMVITYADAQIARGTIDLVGAESATGAAVRVQADFVAIVDRLANQF